MDITFYLRAVIYSNVALFILFYIHQTAAIFLETNFTEFTIEPDFDGYRCNLSDTVFELKRSNLFSCSLACFKDTFCSSVLYQPEFEDCIGCQGFYHADVLLTGAKYVGRYSGPCYPGWTEGERFCYYISPEKTNWTDALNTCQSMHGGLLNKSEYQQFEEQEHVQYWTDLKYDKEVERLFTSSGHIYTGKQFFEYGSDEIACVYHNRTYPNNILATDCERAYNFICKLSNEGNR